MVWEAATLPVHLHHYYGDYRGDDGSPYSPANWRSVNRLVLERDALDIEWRNPDPRRNALGDHSRAGADRDREAADATR